MAGARVKGTGKVSVGGTTGGSGSFASLPSAGNFIVVCLMGNGSGATFNAGTVTDNQGNTYALAQQTNASNRRAAIFYAQNLGAPSGTFTVTVTAGANWFGHWSAAEYSGMATASVLDQVAGANGSSWEPSTTTATTTQADELIIACCIHRSNQNDPTQFNPDESLSTPTSPVWIEESAETDGSGNEAGQSIYRFVTATGVQKAHWSNSYNADWTASMATFKVDAGGSPPATTYPGACGCGVF